MASNPSKIRPDPAKNPGDDPSKTSSRSQIDIVSELNLGDRITEPTPNSIGTRTRGLRDSE